MNTMNTAEKEWLLAEFADTLFAALSPAAIDEMVGQVRELLVLLESEIGLEAAWQEWAQGDASCEMTVLHQWLLGHQRQLSADNITALRNSVQVRAYQWAFTQNNVVALSEAEKEWGVSNLRGNHRDTLPMKKIAGNWVTTVVAMKMLFGRSQGKNRVRQRRIRVISMLAKGETNEQED